MPLFIIMSLLATSVGVVLGVAMFAFATWGRRTHDSRKAIQRLTIAIGLSNAAIACCAIGIGVAVIGWLLQHFTFH